MTTDNKKRTLKHYGILRKSGRYPWGSGQNPYQRASSFQSMVAELRSKGLTDVEISKALGFSSTKDFRATASIAKDEVIAQRAAEASKLSQKGWSNVKIAEKMGVSEGTIRGYLKDQVQDRENITKTTAEFLRNQVEGGGFFEVGAGTEHYMNISREKLNTALAVLKSEEDADGNPKYRIYYINQPQMSDKSKKTTITVLTEAREGAWQEVKNNPALIKNISGYSEDGGRSFISVEPPKSVALDRVAVRYGNEGGAQKDGVIELRRGVPDLDLKDARYAQVRIAVDGTHFLKGMAVYSDDLPPGVDILFNTNKNSTGNKKDAMKPLRLDSQTGQVDTNFPFGSMIRQLHYTDKSGKRQLSALNIVGSDNPDGETSSGMEGGWYEWSRTLSSQMLSKQNPALAKQQLDIAYKAKQAEFDEIMSLNNPAVRAKLLRGLAQSADSSAEHLKAAGLPRTRNHVILPINSMKDTEVYAPHYKNGEKVVLIRHPHGGIFEIPELTVNNRNREAQRVLGRAKDAIGINSKVAEQLSGADFDGDTVLVIPNNPTTRGGKPIKTAKPLAQLKDFDPKTLYKGYKGMKTIDGGYYDPDTDSVDYRGKKPAKQTLQSEMGKISNLITDMTIQGAHLDEIARAVKHSMVVIDSEKHRLNYKQSAKDNNIAELKNKYQKAVSGSSGASTLISKARGDTYIPEIRERRAAEGGPIDKETGRLVYVPTGNVYVNKSGKTVPKQTKTTNMRITDDAHTLSSGTAMEGVYADHANRMKALANRARKEMVNTPPIKVNPSAKITYAKEVESLNSKLRAAQMNAPRERKAQAAAHVIAKAMFDSNPDLSPSDKKKIEARALVEARARAGAKKPRIDVTDQEWAAIQAGAISQNRLASILDNMDQTRIKELATPRDKPTMSAAMIARAKSLANRGYTQSEIADQLGVSTSTISNVL